MTANSSARRVVITGLGVVSPLATTPESLFDALVAGETGVRPLTGVPGDQLPVRCGAEVRDFTGAIGDFGEVDGDQKKTIRKAIKVMCREIQMGVAACQLALQHAGWNAELYAPERIGVEFGSDYILSPPEELTISMSRCIQDGAFEYDRWGSEGIPQLQPLWLLKFLPNMPASHTAIFNDFRGPNNSLTLREASSDLVVGEAMRIIQRGHADMMLAGATGTRIHALKTIHALQSEEVALGDDAAALSRPFDRDRAGMVLGEGAGCLVLEERSSAVARGATIYAEVVGAGSSTVVGRDGVSDRRSALANAGRAALAEAKIAPESLGHIHAHGLSTRSCDIDEAAALSDVLGAAATRTPVVAAKSAFGNLGAGGGLVQLAASAMALHQGRLFPLLNYDAPDEKCPIRAAVAGDGAGASMLNWSVTPQGQAGAVCLQAA